MWQNGNITTRRNVMGRLGNQNRIINNSKCTVSGDSEIQGK